jgi:rhodanese-related sulfurtransferase
MKNLLLMTLVATAIAFGQQGGNGKKGGGPPPSQAKVLTVEEFDALAAKPESLLVIDVRRPDEVSTIGGFPVYLSIQQSELEKSLVWIPRDRTIVTVSNHAARGGRAADILAKAGFKVAGTIGAETYSLAGGKLVTKIPVPLPAPAEARK